MTTPIAAPHQWRFFRSGGFDQVSLTTGEDLRHLGELDVDLALHYPKVRATFWSKEQRTLSLLQQELKPLQERLKQLGVEVEELHARYGALPGPSRNQIRTRWVDERA